MLKNLGYEIKYVKRAASTEYGGFIGANGYTRKEWRYRKIKGGKVNDTKLVLINAFSFTFQVKNYQNNFEWFFF